MASHKHQQKCKFINYINKTLHDFHANGVVLVFKASWCKPCKYVIKQLEDVQSLLTLHNVVLRTIDIDEMTDNDGVSTPFFQYLTTQRVVRGVPSLLLYLKNGEYCNYGKEYSPDNCLIYPDFFCDGFDKHVFSAFVRTIKNIPLI